MRINAGDKDARNTGGAAIVNAYRNKFVIPLDFEMLDSTILYYQSGLGNRLCYELTFNDYNRVIVSGKSDVKYEFSDISLEYKIVTHSDLASHISGEYKNMVLLYDRVLRHRQVPVNKSDMKWNWSFDDL